MRVSEITEYLDVYSAWKALAWREKLERLAKGELIAPVFMEIHPEAWCPHDCSFCAYRNSGWEDMKFFGEWAKGESSGQKGKAKGKRIEGVSGWSKELAFRLPREMMEEGVLAVEITGSGEPLAYRYIKELFEGFAEYGRDVALVTNGQLLADKLSAMKNLRWARFSIDAFTSDTYSKVHGVTSGVFSSVVENFGRMVDAFPDAYIGVSFIVTRDNFGEIFDGARFWKRHGAKNVRFSFEYEPTGTANLTTDQKSKAEEQIQRARRDLAIDNFRIFGQIDRLDSYKRPNTDFSYCGYQMLVWNIGYDANVYPCCIEIYRPEMVVGNLNEVSLKEIIYGEKRKKYIEEFDVKKCHPCWLRNKNIAIETMLVPAKRIGHAKFV